MKMINNEQKARVAQKASFLLRMKFAILVGAAIIIAVLLVSLSLYLYNRSGAAQLDLSLPGFQEQREQAQRSEQYDTFRASGELDARAMEYFDDIYSKQRTAILKEEKGFDPEKLSDKQLEIQVD